MNSDDFSATPPQSQSALSAAISQARAIIETEIAPKVPGLSVAVSIDGAMVWSQQFGYADLSARTPVTPTTRFRIRSVSKPWKPRDPLLIGTPLAKKIAKTFALLFTKSGQPGQTPLADSEANPPFSPEANMIQPS